MASYHILIGAVLLAGILGILVTWKRRLEGARARVEAETGATAGGAFQAVSVAATGDRGILVEFKRVGKRYDNGPWILRDFSARLDAGINIIIGGSGVGKTTFLNLLGGLDLPDAGVVLVRGMQVSGATERGLCLYRRYCVSWIFQELHLVGHQSALENAAFPLLIKGISRREALREAGRYIDLVGLSPRARARPAELSGGEKQRVAIARAFVSRAPLIVADEPTGSLDPQNAGAVMRALVEITKATTGRSVVLVTHSKDVLPFGDRVYRLETSGLRRIDGHCHMPTGGRR